MLAPATLAAAIPRIDQQDPVFRLSRSALLHIRGRYLEDHEVRMEFEIPDFDFDALSLRSGPRFLAPSRLHVLIGDSDPFQPDFSPISADKSIVVLADQGVAADQPDFDYNRNSGGAESVTNTESLATRGREGGRPLVLMISLGSAPYREYLLRAISARFDIHAFLTTDPPWGREYLHGTTLLPSTLDGPAMARAALELNAKTPVSGVLCFDEARIHAASQVARELQLPNGEPETIRRMRDKGLTRAALDAANVAQPRSVSVRTLEQAVDAATRLGYPVILKPRDLGASLGVVRVDSADELAAKYAFTWSTRGPEAAPLGEDGSILVEECVMGEEISVDSAIQGGKVVPLFVARKVVGYPPFAEEVGHYVDAADPLLEDQELVGILQDSHTALGVMDGCTHTEIMLTADGPRIIEVNGRLGGDVIPYLGMLATGIDPGIVAASIACGIQPDLAATRSRVAGVRFFYVEQEDTTIESVTFRPEGLPAAVDRLVPIARAGAVVSPPPKGTWWGRVAYATVVADSREACSGAIAAAAEALSVTTS